jgi:hypothetical protein
MIDMPTVRVHWKFPVSVSSRTCALCRMLARVTGDIFNRGERYVSAHGRPFARRAVSDREVERNFLYCHGIVIHMIFPAFKLNFVTVLKFLIFIC